MVDERLLPDPGALSLGTQDPLEFPHADDPLLVSLRAASHAALSGYVPGRDLPHPRRSPWTWIGKAAKATVECGVKSVDFGQSLPL